MFSVGIMQTLQATAFSSKHSNIVDVLHGKKTLTTIAVTGHNKLSSCFVHVKVIRWGHSQYKLSLKGTSSSHIIVAFVTTQTIFSHFILQLFAPKWEFSWYPQCDMFPVVGLIVCEFLFYTSTENVLSNGNLETQACQAKCKHEVDMKLTVFTSPNINFDAKKMCWNVSKCAHWQWFSCCPNQTSRSFSTFKQKAWQLFLFLRRASHWELHEEVVIWLESEMRVGVGYGVAFRGDLAALLALQQLDDLLSEGLAKQHVDNKITRGIEDVHSVSNGGEWVERMGAPHDTKTGHCQHDSSRWVEEVTDDEDNNDRDKGQGEVLLVGAGVAVSSRAALAHQLLHLLLVLLQGANQVEGDEDHDARGDDQGNQKVHIALVEVLVPPALGSVGAEGIVPVEREQRTGCGCGCGYRKPNQPIHKPQVCAVSLSTNTTSGSYVQHSPLIFLNPPDVDLPKAADVEEHRAHVDDGHQFARQPNRRPLLARQRAADAARQQLSGLRKQVQHKGFRCGRTVDAQSGNNSTRTLLSVCTRHHYNPAHRYPDLSCSQTPWPAPVHRYPDLPCSQIPWPCPADRYPDLSCSLTHPDAAWRTVTHHDAPEVSIDGDQHDEPGGVEEEAVHDRDEVRHHVAVVEQRACQNKKNHPSCKKMHRSHTHLFIIALWTISHHIAHVFALLSLVWFVRIFQRRQFELCGCHCVRTWKWCPHEDAPALPVLVPNTSSSVRSVGASQ